MSERVFTTETPASTANDSNSPRVLGADVKTTVAGSWTAAWIYIPGPTKPATVTVGLWAASAPGVLLATGSGSPSATGWFRVQFNSPVVATANFPYTVAAEISLGAGATNPDYGFTSGGLSSDISNGQHLTMVAGTGRFKNNVGGLVYPDAGSTTVLFLVDLEFAPSLTPMSVGITTTQAALTVNATLSVANSSPPVTYVIEWGDGQQSVVSTLGPFPHTYAAAGLYAILVTATDSASAVDSAACAVSLLAAPQQPNPTLDQICTFFGGAYNSFLRAYASPTIPIVGKVKRGFGKNLDFADFFPTVSPGVETGAVIIVTMSDGNDRRLTLPAVGGRKHTSYKVQLHCFIWSRARYAEDAQDTRDALRSAIVTLMRTDPTCGSGGFEAGGFQVGIPDQYGAGGDIEWFQDLVETDPDSDMTKMFLLIQFEAHEIPVG